MYKLNIHSDLKEQGKNMKKNIVMSLCGLMILAGCTGFNQDPLKGQEEAIRNAKPFDSKIETADTIPEGAVRLDLDGTVAFKEGQRSTLDLKVKSFLTGYSYSFEILNPELFKNATISNTNQLIWTPAPGLIPAGKTHIGINLMLNIIAIPISGGGKMRHATSVLVFVENDLTKPVIKNVVFRNSANPYMIEEGSMVYMTVTATDTNGSNTSGMMPSLNFRGKLEPYLTTTSTRYLAATQEWEFEVTADLTMAEVTRGMDSAQLNIQAVDRFGSMSLPRLVNFTVLTKFGYPISTFSNTTTFKAGILNNIPFTIYDSNSEAILTLLNQTAPSGVIITCERSVRVFQQCNFAWTPAVTDIGKNFTATLSIQSKNMNAADSRAPVNSLTMSFNVN